ncbi:MAG TPA: 50S ribosomal protein L32 [Myxococcales bacterium]|nr:50S ribosomal protein L32 [Myxococcales bacterium]HIN87024.1 50S ribosomal protein L32 [Myxococcales bacterium]
MPVPKKRTSTSRRNRRRANHDKVERPNLSTCSRCGAFKMPHRVCGACGYYKDRQVIETEGTE